MSLSHRLGYLPAVGGDLAQERLEYSLLCPVSIAGVSRPAAELVLAFSREEDPFHCACSGAENSALSAAPSQWASQSSPLE